MFWFSVMQLFSVLVDLILIRRQSDCEKDLELLMLRHQVEILKRQLKQTPRVSRSEKLPLAVLTARLKVTHQYTTKQLRNTIRLFQPETVLRWHRDMVRWKWRYSNKSKGGRPRTRAEIEQLVVRLARKNARWGYGKIEGELLKLGIEIGETTVVEILERHHIPPSPERIASVSWRHLMNHYKEQLIACDFFTVETVFLQTIYVLFIIEIGTRRVHLAGCTAHPRAQWVTQQARHFVWTLQDEDRAVRFLIHDRDKAFAESFDTVFRSEHIKVIHTPVRAPNANAFAERWVRTVREECLDHLLIINQAHLTRVLREFIDYYNRARPHQGLKQQIPIAAPTSRNTGTIRRRDVLGGIIHDYYRVAA